MKLYVADTHADLSMDDKIAEMHDRLIVGAARRLGATLISADRLITSAGLVPLVW